MNPASASIRRFASATFALGLVLTALLTAPARAEDPLLGQIKVIKCVGCDPGAVNLVVHDPIDVRDFEVQIKESDYQKIVTPLAGKTVYEKEGCFYWLDAPKSAKPLKDKPKAADKKPIKNTARKDGAPSDTAAGPEASASSEAPAPEGVPSRCIPYVVLQPKPSAPGAKKDED
jgi:hypothetical protein